MIEIRDPVIYFPWGDDSASVIFPMSPQDADDVKCLVTTLLRDCVLERSDYGETEDDCYICARHGDVNIVAGYVESCIHPDHPQYGLRLDLWSRDPSNLDYTQRQTELCLDARLAAAAAVRVILAAAAC